LVRRLWALVLVVAIFVAGAPSRAGAAATCSDVTYTPRTASRAQQGTLCVPESLTSGTVIVLVHGGGGYEGSRADLRAWQRWYAAAGVATISIDYALTGDRDPLYPLAEQNVKAAVEYVRTIQDELETSRVVVQGHSAGSRLGAIVLTTPDDPAFAGRELRTGVSDAVDGFIGFYGYYGGSQFRARAYYGGAVPATARAVANAARASGPVLLFHGSADALVPVARSRRFAGALRAAGLDVQLSVVAGGGHGYDGYGATSLTRTGRRSASTVLAWLSSSPPRP
jgi:acetyl esterase/lipase